MPRVSTIQRALIAVNLSDVFQGAAEADVEPKWVEVTKEGDYQGYMGGLRPFRFTRADLDKMVANIKTHPSYKLDANNKPIGHVIPWDFNHASEADPTTGALPASGAPAQGWTLDLEVRNGADGKAELWALTQFLEPARTYVKAGQYKWASVAVQFNTIDPVSGQNVGHTVTSIALTNTPFVEGMQALAASRVRPGKTGDSQVNARGYYYEAASTISDAICQMRELFGLAETSSAAEILAQINVVQGWYASGAAPMGTDPQYIVGSLRKILNLPTMSPDADVLSDAAKSIGLLQQQAATAVVPNGAAGVTNAVPVVAASKGKTSMSDLLKTLSVLFGVREAEDAVVGAGKDLLSLRAGIMELFKLERDTTSLLLATAKEAEVARSKLVNLFTALGVADPDQAVAKVAEMMSSAAKLKEVMPELDALRITKKQNEEQAAETDVAEAIAACKLPESVKPALMLLRREQPETFAKTYPKGAAPAQAPAKPAGATVVTPEARTALTTRAPIQNQTLDTANVINLSKYPGSNPTARAKAHLAATVPNWDKLTNERQWEMAINLKKQANVIDESQAQAAS